MATIGDGLVRLNIMMKTVDNLDMFYNLMPPKPLIESPIVDYLTQIEIVIGLLKYIF